jgi:DNA-binding YbaB/EbfC family protein
MDMRQIMKQAQAMQAGMQQAQEELAKERVEASAGGGMVTITASGSGDVIAVKIDPEAIDPNDVEMLEDMVLAAINEAHRMAGEIAEQRMSQVTGGMSGMPGLGGLM